MTNRQHWRGFSSINVLNAAPMLVFTRNALGRSCESKQKNIALPEFWKRPPASVPSPMALLKVELMRQMAHYNKTDDTLGVNNG